MKRKVIFSIMFGLLGLLISRFGLSFDIGPYKFPITFYLVFPLLASLAYGFPYGLLAYAAGFFLFPIFYIDPAETLWTKVGNSLRIGSWLAFHGLWIRYRIKKSRKPLEPLLVQVMFVPLHLLFLKIFSAHWNMEQWILSTFMPFYIVAVADGLYTSPPIRQLLNGETINRRIVMGVNKIISVSILLGVTLALIVTVIHNITHGSPEHGLLHQGSALLFKNLILIGCVFGGGAYIAKIFARILEREIAFENTDIKYKTLFNDLSTGVIFQDENGKIIEANPIASEILRLSFDQMVGIEPMDQDWSLIDTNMQPLGKNLPSIEALHKQVKLFNRTIGVQYHSTNTLIWIEIDAWPINLNNSDIKVVATFKDVTSLHQAQKALKISESNYRRAFDNSSLAFALHEIILDADGFPIDYRYLAVNKAFEAMTGLKQHSTIGRTIKELHPQVETSWIEQFGKVALTGQAIEIEDHTNLTNRAYRVSAYQPAPLQFAALFYDVTPFYKVHNSLRKTQGTLQKKNEDLENLLYILSHDLRAPLVNLEGFNGELSAALQDFAQNPQDREAMQEISTAQQFILSATGRMSNIINGALKLSRITKNPLVLEKIDMNSVVAECLQVLNFQIKAKKATIDLESLPACVGDHGLVSQVMLNLIDNALKYSTDNYLEIKIGGYIEADYAVYMVRDYGIGIPTEHLEKIFKPFQRLVHGEIPGDGLGLALVRRILESMNGSITAVQPQDKKSGIIFEFRLPLSKNEAPI